MASPAATSQRSLRRRPLQPRNTQGGLVGELHPKPKQNAVVSQRQNGKENSVIPTAPSPPVEAPLSLAEELEVARRRRQRLRLERDRTEKMLRERDLTLEKGMKAAEKGELEQRELQVELQRLLWLFNLQSLFRSDRVLSLREQDQGRRERSSQWSQSVEQIEKQRRLMI